MADDQTQPGEVLGWLFYKNSPSGAALTNADGDNNMFFFPGGEAQTSAYGIQNRTIAAVASACFTSSEKVLTSGAQVTINGCSMMGAQTFMTQFVNGLVPGYDGSGNVITIDIEGPDDASCNTCAADVAGDKWSLVELVCWRDCDGNIDEVRGNVARQISAAVPSGTMNFGGAPGANSTNFPMVLTLEPNDGWGDGPGDVFPIFEDTGGAVDDTRPVSLGFTFPTPADATVLLAECGCDLSWAGVPITAALVTAGTVPATPLIGTNP